MKVEQRAKKMNKNIALIIIFLIAFPIYMGAQNDFKTVSSLESFRKKLTEASNSIRSVESKFTQTKYMDMLSEKIVSEGKFYYSNPDKICLDYTSPVKYLIVINGKKIKIVSDGKKNTYDIGSNKMMNQMNSLISACMTGNLDNLSSDYTLEIKENKTQYWIKVIPKGNARSYLKSIDIYLDGKEMSVQRLRLTESSADYTEYVFTQQKKNSNIPDEIFSVK